MNDNQKSFIIGLLIALIIFVTYSLNSEYQIYKNNQTEIENISSDINDDNDYDNEKDIYDNNEDEDNDDYNKDYDDDNDYEEPEIVNNESSKSQKKYQNLYVNDEINKMFPGNYLDRVLANENLVRWHHTSFPLNVYVEYKSNLPSYYKPSVEEAFTDWQKATGGFVSFKFIGDKKDANIICLFPDDFDSRIKKDGNTVGVSRHNIHNKKIENATIEFASQVKSKPMSAKFLKAVATHEIGHALGLNGHSINKQDIMYPTTGENSKISDADINTLKFLYSIIPDACDKEYDAQYRDKFWTTDDIFGDSNQRIDLAVQRMKDDIEVTNNYRLNNYAKLLGYKYYKNKDYENAIKEYKNSIKYTDADNTEQISYITYMIALCYTKLGDYNSALEYADYYYDKETKPDRLNLIAEIYINTKNTEKAKSVLIKTLDKNPKSYNSYILLGKIYNNEKNFEAFKRLADKAKIYFPDNTPIWYGKQNK